MIWAAWLRFSVFYIQHWILNGYLPNGKENGEHMDQINREKIGLFSFFPTGLLSPTLMELLTIYAVMQYIQLVEWVLK